LAATEYNDWFHVGAEDGGTFPLVDFAQGDTAVSLKSADTTGKSWLADMKNHIEDLGTRGVIVNDHATTNVVLDLRVQPGGAEAAQSLIDYGAQFGVRVIIKEYP
jgi:filamentous hemagglutinin